MNKTIDVQKMNNYFFDLPDDLIILINEKKELIEEREEEEADEKRLKFNAYSCETNLVKKICVAGGGLSNGNSYAEIVIHYAKTSGEDYNLDIIEEVYYEEHGRNPVRKYVGNDIEWGEDDEFRILEDDEYVLNDDIFN